MAVTIAFKGRQELIDKLEKLDNAVRNRIARRAAKTAMVPVGQKAKSLIKENDSIQSKSLLKSIGGKQKVFKKTGVIIALIGPRVGKKFEGEWKGRVRKPWKYAHLVELGTKSGGWRTSPTEAKPFLKPALITQQRKVVTRLGNELGRRIRLEAKK